MKFLYRNFTTTRRVYEHKQQFIPLQTTKLVLIKKVSSVKYFKIATCHLLNSYKYNLYRHDVNTKCHKDMLISEFPLFSENQIPKLFKDHQSS